MTGAGQTVCLCMIVKNEAPVIRRCLDSVRGLIDAWVIVDTGSTDGTQDIVRAHLAAIPGALYARPWVDFAHNRTEALALARDRADYTLIIDADDTLEAPKAFRWPALTADGYTLRLEDSGIVYERPQLVRSALPWRYEGVLHEYLTCEGAGPTGHVDGLVMRRNHDGARRKDPETYRRDAAILEAALETETRPFLLARYRFYLAQSYRDCRAPEKALEHYLARGDMGFWEEEVFYSFYQAAKLREELGHPEQDVIDTYLRAADALPTRAEALHGASRFCRYKGRNAEGYEIARRGLDIPLRPDALFVEPWIYEFGLLDEYAINAYWSGHYAACLDASLKILAIGKIPAHDISRVVANARFARERMPPPHVPNLGQLGRQGFIDQHSLIDPPQNSFPLERPPKVLIAILAKQKEESLPLYLHCIEALDYPKSEIVLYIRTNNNTDRTEEILRAWVDRVGAAYAHVVFEAEDVETRVERFAVHEWNKERFKVLGAIRERSLSQAIEHGCDFYFVSDVDNFLQASVLRDLVSLNLPIVAPFLRSISQGSFYSNYHAEIDGQGYYKECDQYHWILNRWVRGIFQVPVVHCTYLVRRDALAKLRYIDHTDRFEYVIFSDSARIHGIRQYIDNRRVYGYIYFAEGGMHHEKNGIDLARTLLGIDHERSLLGEERSVSSVTSRVSGHPRAVLSRPIPAEHQKTLIFCTAFGRSMDVWNTRYRRWLQAIQASKLRFDQILLVDDGSPILPDWRDVRVLETDGQDVPTLGSGSPILVHFSNNLGRWAGHNYPGWYRSFAYAAAYAKWNGFRRLQHVESDSFVISDDLCGYLNSIEHEWVALWDGYFNMPESAIQVADGQGLDLCYDVTRQDYSTFVHKVIENELPFTRVEKKFHGGKFPEFLNYVPHDADYVVQATEDYQDHFLWWLNARRDNTGACDDIPGDLSRTNTDCQIGKLITSQGTVVYVNPETLQLSHGPVDKSPDNAFIIKSEGLGRIIFRSSNKDFDLQFTATRSRPPSDSKPDLPLLPVVIFRLESMYNETIGLKSGLRWLSAEPSGAVVLNKRQCFEWERFRINNIEPTVPAAPVTYSHSSAARLLPKKAERTLVIYHYFEKNEQYMENLRYFIRYGMDSSIDYIFCINGRCSIDLPEGRNIRHHCRNNEGFDFGGYAEILDGTVNFKRYQFYVFMNCTVRGPFLPNYYSNLWTRPFLDLLSSDVKLVGCAINILSPEHWAAKKFREIYAFRKIPQQYPLAHVMSMFFVLDSDGLGYLISRDFFRRNPNLSIEDTIVNFEIRLSQEILANGWNLSCLLAGYRGVDYRHVEADVNSTSYLGDPCFPGRFFGRSIHPLEAVFFKTNRGICDDELLRSYELVH